MILVKICDKTYYLKTKPRLKHKFLENSLKVIDDLLLHRVMSKSQDGSYIMRVLVLLLDGNSKHDTQAWGKPGLFSTAEDT